MRRGLKVLVRRPEPAASRARRIFPDEEGTERYCSGTWKSDTLYPAESSPMRRGLKGARGCRGRCRGRRPAESSPMRRGLKGAAVDSLNGSIWARRIFPDEEGTESSRLFLMLYNVGAPAESSPMRRGLKAGELLSNEHSVSRPAESSPMRRGLKDPSARRLGLYLLYPQNLPR